MTGPLIEAEHVHEPVDAVVQINVSGAGWVPAGEVPRRRTREKVTGRIADFVIGLGFEDPSRAILINQLGADEVAGAVEGIAGEEVR
jgi:hypothetical protein